MPPTKTVASITAVREVGAKVGASDFSPGATLGCGVVRETGGIGVGDETGAAVGDVVGDALGELVGDDVGETDKPTVGLLVGDEDGSEVSEADGDAVGELVEDALGELVGDDEGETDTPTVGVGLLVGEVLGDAENDALDGEDVGEVETTSTKSIAPG